MTENSDQVSFFSVLEEIIKIRKVSRKMPFCAYLSEKH